MQERDRQLSESAHVPPFHCIVQRNSALVKNLWRLNSRKEQECHRRECRDYRISDSSRFWRTLDP